METKDRRGKRSLDEVATALWQVIDEAKGFLEDPKSTPADKKVWAKVLGDTIAVLNKVVQAQKGEELREPDLEEIFGKIPERYEKMATKALKESTRP